MSSSPGRWAAEGSLGQFSHAAGKRKDAEMNLVPMIDIFTVLVTFLLMTAIFSRIVVLQLNLLSANAGAANAPPPFRLEVIVRKQGFELTNGSKLIASIPNVDGSYDIKKLHEMAQELKKEYPDATEASVLLERDIEYNYLIKAMDAIRTAEEQEVAADGAPVQGEGAGASKQRIELFPSIAVGDAPP